MNLSLTLTNGQDLLSHIWRKRAFYHTEWCRGDQITGTCATFGAARNLGPHEARKAAPARAIAAQCRPGRALARPDSSRAYGVEQATVPASQPAEIRRYLGMFVLGWEWINCNYRSGFFRKLVQ